jgi:hypothetical protein
LASRRRALLSFYGWRPWQALVQLVRSLWLAALAHEQQRHLRTAWCKWLARWRKFADWMLAADLFPLRRSPSLVLKETASSCASSEQ